MAHHVGPRPRSLARPLALVLALVGSIGTWVGLEGRTTPGIIGEWRTLPYTMPINPIHLALLRTGKVLVVAGSGNLPTETNFTAGVWDPQSGDITVQSLTWDMFCNGMVALADGRIFINGGNLRYDPFYGEPRNAVYDPLTDTFTDLPNMAHGRWYPTVTMLGDGRILSFSGLLETGGTNKAVEIYDPVTNSWSPEYLANWTPPLYPRQHLLPDGRVLVSGSQRGTRTFNPATLKWASVASTNYTSARKYGTSVMLPLDPADGYRARVMIFGGGNPATDTTEIIDMSATTPQWAYGPSMSQPRIEMNATMLPDGKILAIGGSLNDEDTATASYNADLYDPSTNTFASAGANAYPRLYHSASLLLPDATVAFMGGNPVRGVYERHIEIYSPPYLFNADGTPASRPLIATAPGLVHYGETFAIGTPQAGDISSVVLVRPGAPTHAIDMDQRLVRLSFTATGDVVSATAPPNGNIAPPGYYLLFVLDSHGTPSTGRFVRFGPAPPNQLPTATITTPTGDVTIAPGESVDFAGAGSDPDGTIAGYAWSFPGGTPTSSTVASPGPVAYATGGTYTASLHVTDDGGGDSATENRTINVADFALAASPSSLTLDPGGSGDVTLTATALGGFAGSLDVTVTGLPTGVTASLAGGSIIAPGQAVLTIATTPTTAPGIYPLTVNATAGALSHAQAVTLIVAGNFALAASPDTITARRGTKAKYTVTVTGTPTAPVTLAVEGLPKRISAKFTPASLAGAGTSTLTVTVRANAAPGTYALSIVATSGGASRSVPVTLVVQ